MRRSSLARPLIAVVAAVLVSGALAGCTGFSIDGGCTTAYASGDASSTVTATGAEGKSLNVDFPTPLISSGIQRTVLNAGDGTPAEAGSTVSVNVSFLNGTSGDYFTTSDGTSIDALPADLRTSTTATPWIAALACAAPGSRLAIVGDGMDLGILSTAGTPVVVVVDVVDTYLGKANGFNQLPLDGMPTVVTAVDGTPGVTVAAKTMPSQSRVSTIKAGGGDAVAEGDSVLIQIRNWAWAADDTVTLGSSGDTWTTEPTTVTADKTTEQYEDLVGAKVGSQLLVVIPAADGSGTATIYVIDILGITAHAG